MKKENIYKFLYAISIFLIIIFFIKFGIDYFNYDNYNNSAPFYIVVLEREFKFLLSSIIVFIVGVFCKKKFKKSK